MIKYIIGFVLFFSGIIFVAIGYFSTPSSSENTVEPIVHENIVNPSPSSSPRAPLFFSAEIQNASEENILVSLASGSGVLKEVLPSWYSMNSDGIIHPIRSNLKEEIMQISSISGINVIPTIQIEWQNKKEHFLLTHEKKLQVAGKILDLVEKEPYDGINLNIKKVPDNIQYELTALFEKISEDLRKKNKKYYITINEQRYDSKKNITMVIPFSDNVQKQIENGKRNNIANFSFQFLGSENPNVWGILKTIQ